MRPELEQALTDLRAEFERWAGADGIPPESREDDKLSIADWKDRIQHAWQEFSRAAYDRQDKADMRKWALQLAAVGLRLAARVDRPSLADQEADRHGLD